jgi:alpha-ketoglutarate-dependent taurine dioxygenase
MSPQDRTQIARLGATAGFVAGLSSEDSHALLAKLEAYATRREIMYRHEWQVG